MTKTKLYVINADHPSVNYTTVEADAAWAAVKGKSVSMTYVDWIPMKAHIEFGKK